MASLQELLSESLLVAATHEEARIDSIRKFFQRAVVWNSYTQNAWISAILKLFHPNGRPSARITFEAGRAGSYRRRSASAEVETYRRSLKKEFTYLLETQCGNVIPSGDNSSTGSFSSSGNIAGYLSKLPKFMERYIRNGGSTTLTKTGHMYRQLIREYCRLPGYFRLVVFERLLQYRKITADLVKENLLPGEILKDITEWPTEERCSTDIRICSEIAVHVQDFVRFWRPELRNSPRQIQFLMTLIRPTKESVLALERNCSESSDSPEVIKSGNFFNRTVHMDDLRPYVDSLIDCHPDLRPIRNEATGLRRERYTVCVLTTIFATLGGVHSPVTFKQLYDHKIPDLFFACATRSLTDVPPFNLKYFQEIETLFEQALTKQGEIDIANKERSSKSTEAAKPNGISFSALRKVIELQIPNIVLARIRSRFGLTLIDGKLTFEHCLWFLLMREDCMTSYSLNYWFRLLDLDDDGYLSKEDLESVYHDYLIENGIGSYPNLSKQIGIGMNIIMDFVNPKRVFADGNFQISRMELRKCTNGSGMQRLLSLFQ